MKTLKQQFESKGGKINVDKNGKIKSINSAEIKLDTPSNDATFNKQDDTANKVSNLASKAAKSGINK